MVILFCNFQICSKFGLEVTMRKLINKLFLSKLYRKLLLCFLQILIKLHFLRHRKVIKQIQHIQLNIDITIYILYN